MVMLKVGLNRIRDLHSDDIDKGYVGTDGTAATESQTALQAGVSATKLAIAVATADKVATFTYTLTSGVGTGNTYREFALIKDGTVEYNRVVFTGEAHTANDDMIITQSVYYDNPE